MLSSFQNIKGGIFSDLSPSEWFELIKFTNCGHVSFCAPFTKSIPYVNVNFKSNCVCTNYSTGFINVNHDVWLKEKIGFRLCENSYILIL